MSVQRSRAGSGRRPSGPSRRHGWRRLSRTSFGRSRWTSSPGRTAARTQERSSNGSTATDRRLDAFRLVGSYRHEVGLAGRFQLNVGDSQPVHGSDPSNISNVKLECADERRSRPRRPTARPMPGGRAGGRPALGRDPCPLRDDRIRRLPGQIAVHLPADGASDSSSQSIVVKQASGSSRREVDGIARAGAAGPDRTGRNGAGGHRQFAADPKLARSRCYAPSRFPSRGFELRRG